MGRRLGQAAIVLVALFAIAQLVQPPHANRPIDPSRSIQARAGTATTLVAVIDRSCADCHSNATTTRWYARVAPLSWLMAYSAAKGREAINFSEWGGYPPDRQRQLLDAVCRDVSGGKMPGAYTMFRPETRLSARDVDAVCADVHQIAAEIKP